MPLTPQEAKEASDQLNALDDADLQAAFKKVDDALISSARFKTSKQECWINIGGWSPRLVEHVTQLYQAKGWTVRFQPDQRDGDALVFSPASKEMTR